MGLVRLAAVAGLVAVGLPAGAVAGGLLLIEWGAGRIPAGSDSLTQALEITLVWASRAAVVISGASTSVLAVLVVLGYLDLVKRLVVAALVLAGTAAVMPVVGIVEAMG